MKFQIISDGACDLLEEYTSMHHIIKVPFYVTFDGSNYHKEGTDINHDEFYQRMDINHEIPKSSLPSIDDYTQAFRPFIEKEIPVICICITSKFSGSYNSAQSARNLLLEDYPSAKIHIIDSTLNTVTQGLYVNEAVRMRDNGLSFDDAVLKLEQLKNTGRIYFTVGSLEYLIKNGRIGKLATIAGDKLGIKPVIVMKDGEISLGKVTRSRKKAKATIFRLINQYFSENNLSKNNYSFITGTGYDYDEEKQFRAEFEQECGINCNKDVKTLIGTTIGCHTGPHPIGIGFIKKYDAE